MLVDPTSKHVLAAVPMKDPENNQVKLDSLEKIVHLYPKLNCYVHDRACSVEKAGRKRRRLRRIKYYAVDKLHAERHRKKCKNSPLTNKVLKRRLKNVNTMVAEQTFSWFRHHARVLNETRDLRHRFLVLRYCKKHNELMDAGDYSHLNEFTAGKEMKKKPSVAYACSR